MAGIVISVQTVTVTIAAGATTGTNTLGTTVNANISVERLVGWNYPANIANASQCMPGIYLDADGITLRAFRNTSDVTNALTAYVEVTQYSSAAIKSVQRGQTTITGATSNTATLSPTMTTTNAAIQFNGMTTTHTSTTQAHFMGAARITATNTVTVSKGTTTADGTVYWVAAEFNSGILNSSTQANNVLVTTSTPATTTITGVTTTQTTLWWGGQTSASTGSAAWCNAVAITLTNGTTVTGTMNNSPSSGTTAYFTAVEHKSVDIKTINRATTTISSGSSSTDTAITAVDTTLTAPNFLGSTTSATASFSTSWIFPKVTLTSATNSRVSTAANTSGNTDLVGWEQVEYIKAPLSGMFLCL